MRAWSIRARTALVFAVAAMVLATGVVVFTNLMSISGAGHVIATVDDSVAGTTGRDVAIAQEGAVGSARQADQATVRLVANLQWQWSAVGIAGAGVTAGGVGWFVSRRMLRPIDSITCTANRLSASNLHERIALDGPDDELRRLSRTINALLDRLQTAFESQRRFVAQASHELRTPLAVQRAALQIGLPDDAAPDDVRATREELLEQNRRTEHIVESLLVLADADRGLDDLRAPVDIGSVAAEVVVAAAGTAQSFGVDLTLSSSLPTGTTVSGDPTLVRQLLVNLISNAVEYNTPGGFVRLVAAERQIVVENSGPVVPDDMVALLVEPFHRNPVAGERGRHSGLGLSIVASIARGHGWDLELAARAEGGLRVTVSLA